ncbi:MATE family efflux transporter [Butyrivibrio sp. MC2021]|uniref:MATE family efflux transporter n=1 Tax=Butyrivibrio sp. MC2021 TaxID=1408306 RepID=UPI0009DDA1B6|nr:MATE family efflux transporter [Butyrivibrio sp. MC2021]
MRRNKTFISSKYYTMLAGGTLTSLLVTAVLMADTFIAGLMLGEAGVAGVNLVMPIYSLSSFFALMFSLGAPILYNHHVGAFQKEEADRTFGTGLLSTIVIGGILLLLLLLFGDSYLRFYGASPEIYEMAKGYLKWIRFVIMLTPVNSLLSGMVYSDGDETVSAVADLISGVGNIILSIILCRIMGIEGLGLASFLSVIAAFLTLFIHFCKKNNSLRLNLYYSPDIVRNIVKYSIVDSSTYLFIAIFTFACNRLVVYFFGSDMIFVASVIILVKELQILFDGIGAAITPLISLYLGEETYGGVHEIWHHAKRTERIESALVTGLILIFAPYIVQIIGVTDPQYIRIATMELRFLSLSMIFTCRLYLDSSYYIVVDKIPLGVLICALRDLVISLPLAVLGTWIGGINGMGICLMLAQPISYVISVRYVKRRYGKENYPLFIADKENSRRSLFYELAITPENVISVRDSIGKDLEQSGCSKETVNKVMLLVEETLMMISENNPKKQVLAECSILLGDSLKVIIKDDGIIFDLTNSDMKVDSLRSYVISNLAENISARKMHFLSLSYNRNVFEIKQKGRS